jgi:hypothetical protein
MSVQNLIMDGQTGMIEIADVKFWKRIVMK